MLWKKCPDGTQDTIHWSKNYLHKAEKCYSEYMTDAYVPDIDENVPLPKNASEAFPDLTPQQELDMRANVIVLMSELTGQPIAPTKDNVVQAQELGKQMMADPKMRPEFSKYPNETLAYLAGMVAQMNVQIVDDLADIKMYVVNHLVDTVEHAKDQKAKLTALRALGEIDGVDAFKKRTETTVKVQTMEEVERELLNIIESVEHKVITVEAREIVQNEGEIGLEVTDGVLNTPEDE